MQRLKLAFAIGLTSAVLSVTGCSNKESETPSVPAPPVPPKTERSETPSPEPLTPLPVEVKPIVPAKPAPPTPVAPPAAQEDSPAQLAAQVKQLEADYYNTADFQKRVGIIYNLSSVESPATIDAVSRLFLNEQDADLKVELVSSLSDIDGENDKKLTLLTGAIRPDQPKDVRLEAIDALADTEDKRAIQILQGLANDPDEEIRDAVQDAIEQVQSDTAETK